MQEERRRPVMGFMMVVRQLTCLFCTLLLAEVQVARAVAAAETTKVRVSTTPVYRRIPQGHESKDFQVVVRVEAPPEADPERRAPVDLVAVLDVSGSMKDPAAAPESKPSRLDLLKTAMKFVIGKLDDTDGLAIVAFNDRPVTDTEHGSAGLSAMSGEGRSNARRRVERLEAHGGTDFFSPLKEAVNILDGRPAAADGRNRVGVIILLTDGEGMSGFGWSDTGISKYPVHTFGLSAAHDPRALLSIAQASRGGTYSFIDEKLPPRRITEALAVFLGGIMTVVAVDTRVTLKTGADQGAGVQIKRIDSGGYERSIACGGACGDIVVGDLYAGEVKNFVVHLHVPASAPSSVVRRRGCDDLAGRDEQNLHLLAVSVRYSYGQGPGVRAISIIGQGHDLFVQRPKAADADADAGRHGPSPVVLQHIVQFEMLEIVTGFLRQHHDHAVLAKALQSRWDEFRGSRQFWAGIELGGQVKDVDATMSGLTGDGTGVGYIYSWVSSHLMQRATTMGFPDKMAAEFLTPTMLLMLGEARKGTEGQEDAVAMADKDAGCACADYEKIIDQRLQLWSRVKAEVPLMYQPSPEASTSKSDHLAAVFREASLQAIDRAMHHDVYLAVVHARNQKRCSRCHYSSADR